MNRALFANDGWLIVRRIAPPEHASGIIVKATPPKIDEAVVVSGSLTAFEDGSSILFMGGEPFEFEGEKLLALKTSEVIAIVESSPRARPTMDAPSLDRKEWRA